MIIIPSNREEFCVKFTLENAQPPSVPTITNILHCIDSCIVATAKALYENIVFSTNTQVRSLVHRKNVVRLNLAFECKTHALLPNIVDDSSMLDYAYATLVALGLCRDKNICNFGLLSLIKEIGSAEISSYETNVQDTRLLHLNLNNGKRIKDVNSATILLLQSDVVMEAVESWFKECFAKTGIENIAIKSSIGKKDSTLEQFDEFTKEHELLYKYNAKNTQITQNIAYNQPLSFVNISFKDGNKWKFLNGEEEVFVTIEDKEFIERIRNGEVTFGKNDIFMVDLAIKRVRTSTGIKQSYDLLKVNKHVPAKKQMSLM